MERQILCLRRDGIKMALDYTVIGQRIKQARLAKNLTQEELAALCDITKSAVEKTENNSFKIITKERFPLSGK